MNYRPVRIAGRCIEEQHESKPLSNEDAYGQLYMCSKCGGIAEIEVLFTPTSLAAFNIYKRFYPGLIIEEDGLRARISGPCIEISDLLAEIIYDYKFYGS